MSNFFSTICSKRSKQQAGHYGCFYGGGSNDPSPLTFFPRTGSVPHPILRRCAYQKTLQQQGKMSGNGSRLCVPQLARTLLLSHRVPALRFRLHDWHPVVEANARRFVRTVKHVINLIYRSKNLCTHMSAINEPCSLEFQVCLEVGQQVQ